MLLLSERQRKKVASEIVYAAILKTRKNLLTILCRLMTVLCVYNEYICTLTIISMSRIF